MSIIKSKIDKNSISYNSNYAHNKKILSELNDLKDKIHKMGPQKV